MKSANAVHVVTAMTASVTVMMTVVVTCAPAVRGSAAAATTTDASRLPGDTAPVSYELRFDVAGPDPGAFNGVARVTARIRADTRTITLNARDLRVTNVTVTVVSGATAVSVLGWTVTAREERLVVLLNASATVGTTLLVTARYAARVRTDGTGVHSVATTAAGPRSDGGDGARPGSIMTQFKSAYARRAFPCYDEPSYKATFQIKVVIRKDQIALSNMPIKKIESRINTDIIHFKITPPMSTYSLAFYVGEFVPNRGNDSRVTVYTRKDHANQTKYIITEASKHLDSLSKYTGIEYTLPKMDLLAVPDLSFEAMENWGLNIYREDLILLREESKTEAKIRASEIVQYEFAHQWFGNLVTSSWWDYAWLNDGFALYFKFFATKIVNENWPMEEWFLVEIHQSALADDHSSKHSITSSVHTPEEIEDVFDDITHKKAASVLRMLRCFVTEDLFQKSLKKYLSDFKENVVEPNDLYERFDSVLNDNQYKLKDGMTIHDFMSNWTLQTGYPVLNITKNETLNAFLVTQSRFAIKSDEIDNNTSAVWHVGLTYTTQSEKNFNDLRPSIWTNESSKLTKVPALNSGWYIFNIQSCGFYRVNYDTGNWNALIKQLNELHDDIHVMNRAQLIDDAFNLARVGYLDYSVPLSLSKYLEKENDATPWYSAINSFSYLIEQMSRSKEGFKNIKIYFSKLVGPIYGKLDYLVSNGNNNINVTKAWGTISTWACRLENTYCVQKSLVYFRKWKSGQEIPADIKDAVFCVGLKNSIGSSTFNMMFNLYTKTNSNSEKASIELALGCSSNRTQLNEYINHILDGSINEKDYRSVITAISGTPLGLNVLYDFLSKNLNKILNEVSNGEDIVKFMYEILATKVTNDNEIEKIKNMKNNLTTPVSLRSSFEKSFEKAIDNQLWFNTYADGIVRWTMKNKISSTSVESPILSVSEQPTPSTSDTTWTTDKSFTSTESEELSSSTSETTWTTDEYFTSTGSEELSSSTSETTWTTNEPTATSVVSGSSHLHYSYIIISIFSSIVVLTNT